MDTLIFCPVYFKMYHKYSTEGFALFTALLMRCFGALEHHDSPRFLGGGWSFLQVIVTLPLVGVINDVLLRAKLCWGLKFCSIVPADEYVKRHANKANSIRLCTISLLRRDLVIKALSVCLLLKKSFQSVWSVPNILGATRGSRREQAWLSELGTPTFDQFKTLYPSWQKDLLEKPSQKSSA